MTTTANLTYTTSTGNARRTIVTQDGTLIGTVFYNGHNGPGPCAPGSFHATDSDGTKIGRFDAFQVAARALALHAAGTPVEGRTEAPAPTWLEIRKAQGLIR